MPVCLENRIHFREKFIGKADRNLKTVDWSMNWDYNSRLVFQEIWQR